MKISPPVLLLLILTLVVLLAKLALEAPTTAIERDRWRQAADNTLALKQALDHYYAEYAKPPDLGTQDMEIHTEGRVGITLLRILLGREDTGTEMQNPRQIAFLNSKVSKNKNRGGLVYTNRGSWPDPEGFYDSWGNSFRVFLRKPDASRLSFPYGGQTLSLDQPFAVFSCGPDKVPGTKDDLKSW